MNVVEFREAKRAGRKLSVSTCYDWWSARILAGTALDAILVGDSAAMVVHGYPTTLSATVEMMTTHVAAVSRGAPKKLLIADMPFPSHRKGALAAMDAVHALVAAGAHAVKLEGVAGHEEVIRHIVQSGIPVMGHVGLVPQSVHALGGYRVQGRGTEAVQRLVEDAQRLEELGCFSIVIEAVPADAARRVTEALAIPAIGIGSGPHVDGQVLVLHDLAGLQRDIRPKFVRAFADGFETIRGAVDAFDAATKDGSFPAEAESYS